MRKKEPLSKKFSVGLKKPTKKHNKLSKQLIVRRNWPKLNYKKLIKLLEKSLKKNKNFWNKNLKIVKIKLHNLKSINKRKSKKFKKLP